MVMQLKKFSDFNSSSDKSYFTFCRVALGASNEKSAALTLSGRNFSMLRQTHLLYRLFSDNLTSLEHGINVLSKYLFPGLTMFFVVILFKSEPAGKFVPALFILITFFWLILLSQGLQACTTTTTSSVNYLASFREQSLRYRKIDRMFIRSCPPFKFTIGNCLIVESNTFMIIMKDFTLNCFITLALSYR